LRPPAPGQPIGELAADQVAAVLHAGGMARIIAPAGSGKTRVLTERARHVLRDWRLPAPAVSIVAFNKRAQLEVQDRTRDLRGLHVRTLNAIALAVVNGAAPFAPQNATVRTIDEPAVRRILSSLVQFPRKRNADPVAVWIDALSEVRLGLRDPADVERRYQGDVDGLVDVVDRYRARLAREGSVDFDEQIFRAVEILLRDSSARHAAQRACRMLLVDEFQDLTPAHVLLVRLLSGPAGAVFGVGDDDQTIYGYSGADPAWLIDFAAMFAGAAAHPLEVNYRCPPDVVAAADRLVRHNARRVAKIIRSGSGRPDGLRVVRADDTVAATVDAVARAIGGGRQPSEIAVLTRVNSLLAPVHVGLGMHGIPTTGAGGETLLERTAIRAALAWLRLAAADDFSPVDLAEALKRPSRPLHPNVASWVTEQRSLGALGALAKRVNNERDSARVTSLADDIAKLRSLARSRASTSTLLATLTDDIGFSAAVSTIDDGRRGMNRTAQGDDLVALAQLAALQPRGVDFEPWLREALRRGADASGVTLATAHRVKGQEWPIVVVHHSEDDQYPHALAEDVEEERRVFHVALTRGSHEVTVVAGPKPSRFLDELHREPPSPEALRARADKPVVAAAPKRGTRDGAAFEKGTVLAAAGLVLVDGGQEWTVESVEADGGVVTRLGEATRRFAPGAPVVTAGRQRGSLGAPGGVAGASIRAYDRLRQARERLRDGKPAYVVFHDATLERIALALPSSIEELRRIDGIGPAKLEQYGDAVLLAVEDARTADRGAQ
jgi:DNA helicase-2/ATP-dependent DNA helicase PcrA